MKNKIIKLLGVSTLCFVTLMGNANALTVNKDGDVITEHNINLSKEVYSSLSKKVSDETIDTLNERAISSLSNSDTELIDSEVIYLITTTKYHNGIPVSEITIPATKEQAKEVAVNPALIVLEDNKLHDIEKENIAMPRNYQDYYSTTSKEVSLQTEKYNSNSQYKIYLNSYWYKVPNLKLYDIMAVRFNSNSSIAYWEGYQNCRDADGTSYEYKYSASESPNNYVKKSNGLGVIMNLKDSAEQFSLHLELVMNSNPVTVYGTYQHESKSGLSLAQAKSFTFGNGLGGVLNHSYSSYYDGMRGVVNNQTRP